jgi:hypothetical protein
MVVATFWSFGELARRLGVLESAVRRVARNRADLPRVRLGPATGVSPEDLDDWRQALIEAGYLPAEARSA